jgi:ribosomal protein S15P/S13E
LPDEQLRKEIREALVYKARRRKKETTQEPKAEKEAVELEGSFNPAGQTPAVTERIDRIKSQLAGRALDPEQARRMLEKIHEIREKLRNRSKDGSKKKG